MIRKLLISCLVAFLNFRKVPAQCIRDAISNCVVYDGTHIKTFDGSLYSFTSACGYTLSSIPGVDLEVNYLRNPNGLQVKYATRIFLVSVTSTGVATFTRDGIQYSIPQSLNGVTVSKPGRMVIVEIEALGIKMRYDGSTVEIIQDNAGNSLQTNGVCGNNDGCSNNDLVMKNGQTTTSALTWVNSWALNSCTSTDFVSACGTNTRLQAQAQAWCTTLFARSEFAGCSAYSTPFMSVCISNYCGCTLLNRYDCVCDMLDAIVRTCQTKNNNIISWRSSGLCPIKCANLDQTFSTCAPGRRQLSCGEEEITDPTQYDCEEGCYCPDGMRLYNGQCLFSAECPCLYNNVAYNNGDTIAQECNTCTCRGGIWDCTKKICVVEGGCDGDPHYYTFDGSRFDFMGKCSYYMVRGLGFDVICDHYVYGSGGFYKDFQSTAPSYCAKLIVITGEDNIELSQNHVVRVNGQIISQVPYTVSGIRITRPSSEFTNVILPNHVTASFNGFARAVVKIPTTMINRVKGLLGTYNKNASDDFTMPDGTIATNANTFGHSWKVLGSCENEDTSEVQHPCEANPTKKPAAEQKCSVIKTGIFAGCSDNPDADYNDCVYDGCYCADGDKQCLCSFYQRQAEKCAAKGKIIDWRSTITECALTCPAGQTYQTCGNSCQRSCADIAMDPNCESECVDGCNCPPGQTLDYNNQCVPITECPCEYDGVLFPSGFIFVDIENNSKYECQSAAWIISVPTEEDLTTYPSLNDFQTKCNPNNFLVFAGCRRTNELTCLNKHLGESPNYDDCTAGCVCREGFIMDTELGMCVRPEDCPCMYKGISYPDNAVISNRDEICTCVLGFWECTPQTNYWEKCSVWGDVHVRTFDETFYSFEGYCKYVLFEHVFESGIFRVTLETGTCSTGSCITAVHILHRAPSGHEDTISFITGQSYTASANLQNLIITNLGVSVMVDVVGLGVRVVWNNGGWVHLHISRDWLSWAHTGLCGKYDNDASNDLIIPGQRANEIVDFVNHYRDDPLCKESLIIQPSDLLLPNDPCNHLYSSVFKTCRYLVDVSNYFDTCIMNAQKQLELSPEQRTDYYCEPIAAYAQECNDVGVPVDWRTAEICPWECPKESVYNSCDNPCPAETCENTIGYEKLCTDKVCSESCATPNCPDGQVYWNATDTTCVGRGQCPVN